MAAVTPEILAWWRAEKRQSLLFFLKSIGLLFAFTSAILLLGYVGFERSYDSWNPAADRLVRAIETRKVGDSSRSAQLPFQFAETALASLPEVKAFARMQPLRVMIRRDVDRFNETVLFVDPSFLGLMDVAFLSGSPNPLARPFSVILSERAAIKYFNTTDVIGQTLSLGGERPITVTAVMRDWPPNSHLNPDFILPIDSYMQIVEQKAKIDRQAITGWDNCHCYVTYLLLDREEDFAGVEEALPALLTRAQGARYATEYPVSLQRVGDIYLRSADVSTYIDHARKGDETQLFVLVAIALILLLTAAINFANFSMAQATLRAREIGIRRVLGASRGAIILRLLGETVLLSGLALVVSYLVALLLAAPVGAFMDRPLTAAQLLRPGILLQILAIAALTSVVAGLFSAVTLARTPPAQLLRSGVGSSGGLFTTSRVRQALVITQLVLSIGLIIAAIGLYSQVDFLNNQPRGYQPDNKIIVAGEGSHDVAGDLKARIAAIPGVESLSFANAVPTTPLSNMRQLVLRGHDPKDYRDIAVNEVDFGFLPSLGVRLVAGRGFGQQFGGDRFVLPETGPVEFNAVINLAAARALGFSEPKGALGAALVYADDAESTYSMTVVGVVDDIRYGSPREAVVPMLYLARDDWQFNRNEPRYLLISTRSANDPGPLQPIRGLWDSMVPAFVGDVEPMSMALDRQLASERKQFQLVAIFATAAVIVSLLGTLGFAAFLMERRAKEMAVRRVLGATRASIARLITSSQLILVPIAAIISFPFAWFGLSRWLAGFEVRVQVSLLWFAIGAILVGITTALALYLFTYRLTARSPAASLKAE